jgi:pentatricopeptide repeat protein
MGHFFSSLFSSKPASTPEEEAQKNKDKDFEMFKYDGMRAQRTGQNPFAIKCFEQALAIKDDFETMNYLVNSYTAANRLDDAFSVLARMIEIRPNDIPTLIAHANLCFMLDKDADAIADCQRVLESDENNSLALFIMGKAKRTTKDFLGAVADLTKAISIKEDFVDAYLLRTELLLEMGQPSEAKPDAEKAVTLAPEEPTSYLLRGRVNQALGDTDAANADYQKTLELDPFNEEATLLSGKMLIEENKLDDALKFFDDAIDLNPNFAKAYAERGRIKNMKGDKDGALADLKKSIELNPEGEEAKLLNGQHTNFDDMYKGGIF